MQVTFKTLKQTSFKLECTEDETVASVKAKIETEKGDEFPANSQKLIHSGKIMEDCKQLKDYKVSEKGFIVVMVTTKGKVSSEPAKTSETKEEEVKAETKPSEACTPAEAETPKVEETAAVEPSKETTASTDKPETPAATTPAAPAASQPSESTTAAPEAETDDFGNALLTGSDFEACVERIMAMGFPREEVQQAMRLSYNNPDRAVEYLISGQDGDLLMDEGENPDDNDDYDEEDDDRAGDSYAEVPMEIGSELADQLFGAADESEDAERIINALLEGTMPEVRDPPSEQGIGGDSQPQQPASVPTAGVPPQAPAAGQPPAAPQQSPQAPGGADPFRELISHPQFQQMRQVLHSNPQLLAQLMEQLYRTNPDLFQVIRNNQERFLAYLNEGAPEGMPEVGGGQPPAQVQEAQDPFSGAGGAGTTIRMTPQEREAIERLKALGFPEMMVIQAYFACDKDEDAAANFLLSEVFGDDD